MHRTPGILTAGTLLIALSLVGCANTTTPATPTSASETGGTPSVSPSSAPSEAPVAAWDSFTTDDGVFSFEHPAEWRVDAQRPEMTYPDVNSWEVSVLDESGATVASLTSGGSGLGGACGAEGQFPITVLDSQAVELPAGAASPGEGLGAPRFQYTALERQGEVTASVGITNTEGIPDSCMYNNLFTVPDASLALVGFADQIMAGPAGQHSALIPLFSTIDEAKAFMDTDEYHDLKRMITSLRITS